MKKHIYIMISMLLIAALLCGCSKKEAKTTVEEEPKETAEEPAEPVLARHEWTNAPAGTRAPAGYSEILDDVIISSLPYKVFCKETAGGNIDYIAYADGISTEEEIMDSGWHSLIRFGNIVFSDAPAGTALPEGYTLCTDTGADGAYHYGSMVYEKDGADDLFLIYGSVYDIQTGSLISQDWFEITTDESGAIIYAIAKGNTADIDAGSDALNESGANAAAPEELPDGSLREHETGGRSETSSEEAGSAAPDTEPAETGDQPAAEN